MRTPVCVHGVAARFPLRRGYAGSHNNRGVKRHLPALQRERIGDWIRMEGKTNVTEKLFTVVPLEIQKRSYLADKELKC